MFGRKKFGSLVCPSCGNLVGVNDDRCLSCGRWNPGLWGFGPVLNRLTRSDIGFEQVVLGTCSVLFVATLLFDPSGIRMRGLFSLLSPSSQSLFLFGASGAVPVFEFGRWWTVLSATWLHGGILHILFNMMWVRQLAPATADLYGTSRMVIIYTVSGACGFAASSLAGQFLVFLPNFIRGAGLTIGASASIFGLLGALVYYSRRGGSSLIGEQARGWVLALFIFGFIMPGIDNWAHLGGFIGGYLSAMWLNPLLPERGDHAILALASMLSTLVAIAVSILHGLSLFG